MKRAGTIILILVVLLGLACGAFAQEATLPINEGGKVANPPKSLQLEYRFQVGEYRRYDMVIIGEGFLQLPGQTEKSKLETRTELTFMQHVEAFVPKDGVWRMEWDMIRGALTLPEFGEITLTIPSLQYEMDKYGAISKVKGLEELAVAPGLPQQESMAKSLGQLTSVGFPKKELKLGDTWEQEYQIEVQDQEPITVKTTSKLLDYEILDGVNCAKILTTYETPFRLSDKKKDAEEKPKPGGAEDASAEKPVVLVGSEKGEFCTHFAYGDGKIMRISGTLEITADLEGKEPVAVNIEPPSTATPEEAARMKQEQEMLKHDVSIKYTMTSVFNPKMPDSAVERKRK